MSALKKVIPILEKKEKSIWLPSKSSTIRVGLVQINNSFSGQNYLPYSVACLRSYVELNAHNSNRYQFLPFIYKRQPIQQIVNNLLSSDIVGFSSSVWNENISLEVARRLKIEKPEIMIIFGGPQVPDKPESYLRTHPYIDLVVHNEGEKTFLDILERFPECDWSDLSGISYLDNNKSFVKLTPVERMRDLEQLPSPFLNGIFDQLIADNPNEKWIGLWETNRGCPFQCTFCDWGSATAGKVVKFEEDRLFLELEWFVRNKVEYIFVCDANFGSLKRDIEIAKHVAMLRKKTGYPQGFSVQSTKNATERAYITQKILADAGLNKGVALSMQSLHTETLQNIKRDNISLETYLELARRFTRDKIETYSDLIIGLPGETYDSFIDGVNTLILTGQHNRIQFNNLSILPNAEMGDPDYLLKYKMTTVRSEIINIHGTKVILDDDVPEMQDVVVGTYSLSAEDWCKSRAVAWMISFLYFDKLAQIPITLLNKLVDISYRDIFESFMAVQSSEYPEIGQIRDFFLSEAKNIQNGGVEYVYSEEWLGVYWPADEYVYIRLTAENKMDDFYSEIKILLLKLYGDFLNDDLKNALDDSININCALISQPGIDKNQKLKLRYNVLDFWRGVCEGQPIDLIGGEYEHKILKKEQYYPDFQKWCKEIVWWGNKKGAYLYPVNTKANDSTSDDFGELAGHY